MKRPHCITISKFNVITTNNGVIFQRKNILTIQLWIHLYGSHMPENVYRSKNAFQSKRYRKDSFIKFYIDVTSTIVLGLSLDFDLDLFYPFSRISLCVSKFGFIRVLINIHCLQLGSDFYWNSVIKLGSLIRKSHRMFKHYFITHGIIKDMEHFKHCSHIVCFIFRNTIKTIQHF